MEKKRILDGVCVVDIPEAGLSVLCGCPANVVKFLARSGVIRPIERDGVRFESGPNAILLSELPVQGGRFCNLGEFPVLQMLYRQGMILPRHPNNTGLRPMIVGLRDQVEAQRRYVYLGNVDAPGGCRASASPGYWQCRSGSAWCKAVSRSARLRHRG